ncbi:MAG: TIGR03087 family PEP-CTERM/XrtA system glycosyltransferase [Parahaliea sp.]
MTDTAPGKRSPLLLLCHRIPYPPDKGDKIRSFHLLRYLHGHYEVHLGAFVDDPDDWRHEEAVKDFCASCTLLRRPRLPGMLPLVRALLRGQPLTLPMYYHRDMERWVRRIVPEAGISSVVIFSAAMGQYVLNAECRDLHRVIDFVDVDSDKWRQYAGRLSWPKSWLYRREAASLLRFEQHLHRVSQASLFVSSSEAELFRQLVDEHPERVDYVNNGVDYHYFDPSTKLDNPYPDGTRALVFTGAMDYWPNIDAVNWFAREVLPGLRAMQADLSFYIVGSNPTPVVQRLGELPGVQVTGRVADVRPYQQYALAVVAPLRVARGVQNKVLEAMSMARPVLVSKPGLEGIPAVHGQEVLLADTSADYVEQLSALTQGRYREVGTAARRLVLDRFAWEESLPRVGRWLEGGSGGAVGGRARG